MTSDDKNTEQGIISIFFIIIVPIILMGTFSLYMYFAEIQKEHAVKKMVYATSETYLSKVNSYLFHEFGLTTTLDEGTLDQMVRYYLNENGLINKTDEVSLMVEFKQLNNPDHFKMIVLNSAKISVARELVDYALSTLDVYDVLEQVKFGISKISNLEKELSQMIDEYDFSVIALELRKVGFSEFPAETFAMLKDLVSKQTVSFDQKYHAAVSELELLKRSDEENVKISIEIVKQKKEEWLIVKNDFYSKVDSFQNTLYILENLYQMRMNLNESDANYEEEKERIEEDIQDILMALTSIHIQEKPYILEHLKRVLLELEEAFSSVKTGEEILDFSEVGMISDRSMKNINMPIADKALLNEYYLMTFSSYDKNCPRRNSLNGRLDGKRKIKGEVEYIISGEPDEKQSIGRIKIQVFGLRWVSNLVSFLTDQNKQMQVTQATIMVPQPWRMLAYTSLFSIWCSAESYSDVNRLLKGEGLKIVKMGNEWTVDLHNILTSPASQILGNGTQVEKGRCDFSKIYYQDYLRILLLMQSENKTITRVMDLINIELYMMSKGRYKLEHFSIGHELDIILSPRFRFKLINGYLE